MYKRLSLFRLTKQSTYTPHIGCHNGMPLNLQAKDYVCFGRRCLGLCIACFACRLLCCLYIDCIANCHEWYHVLIDAASVSSYLAKFFAEAACYCWVLVILSEISPTSGKKWCEFISHVAEIEKIQRVTPTGAPSVLPSWCLWRVQIKNTKWNLTRSKWRLYYRVSNGRSGQELGSSAWIARLFEL